MCLLAAAPSRAANPPSRDDTIFNTGVIAHYVIGQPDFSGNGNNTTAATLRLYPGVATDVYATRPNEYRSDIAFDFDSSGYLRLWVADTANHRVLRFPVGTSLANGMNADLVLGKGTFTDSSAGSGAAGLTYPSGLAFDSSGNLWVSDTGNHRVVRFPTSQFVNGGSADVFIGQASSAGTSANQGGSPAATTLYKPMGIWFDTSSNLWVADMNNNRALRFNNPQSTNLGASVVLGQSNFTTNSIFDPSRGCTVSPCLTPAATLHYPLALATDNNGYLWVADHESNRISRFSSLSNGASADIFIGQSGATADAPNTAFGSINISGGGFTDPGSCAVDTVCTHNAQPANSAQTVMFPHDVSFDGEWNLWATDSLNDRVVKFNGTVFSTNQSATQVLGKANLTAASAPGTGQNNFSGPYAAMHDPLGNLWVVDGLNNRLLMYRTFAFNSVGTTTAQLKLGNNYNAGGTSYTCETDTDPSFVSANKKNSGAVISALTNYSFSSLLSNATYYLRCQASGTPLRVLDSTITIGVTPALSTPTFTLIGFSSFTVNWSALSNSTWTVNEVTLAQDSGFSAGLQVITTTGTNWVFNGLIPNHRYFARIRALSVWQGSGYGNTGFANSAQAPTLATLTSFGKVLPSPASSASTWVNVSTVIWSATTGDTFATSYVYLLDTLPTHIFPFAGGEAVWTPGVNLQNVMTSPNTWYFHIAARNGDNVISTYTDVGPFLYENSVPNVDFSAFRHISSTGGVLSSLDWNDQNNLNWRITLQDTPYAGLNLQGYNLGTSANVIGLWHFDEGYGTSMPDASGVSGPAILTNVDLGFNAVGQSANFLGSASYATVADNANLRFTPASSFTMQAWVSRQGSTFGDVAGKWGAGSGQFGYGIGVDSNGKANFLLDQYGCCRNTVVGATTLNPNNLYFITATYDGTTMRLYVNGALDGSMTRTVGGSASSEPLYMGKAVWLQDFTGRIDEVRILNIAESAQQAATDYENGYGALPFAEYTNDGGASWRQVSRQSTPNPYITFTPGTNGTGQLVTLSGTGFDFAQTFVQPLTVVGSKTKGLWHLDAGAGVTGADTVGTNDLTLTNSPRWVTGVFGSALSFNGSSNYASGGTTNFPTGSASRTLELWFRSSYTGSTTARLFAYGARSANQYFSLYLANSLLTVDFFGATLGSSKPVGDGNWHHAAVTYDGSATKLYVDGIQISSQTMTAATGAGAFTIGGVSGFSEYFPGEIDEIRMTNRDLNNSEIARDAFGNNQITVTAYDMAGNARAAGAFSMLVQTAAPLAVTDLAAANGSGGTLPSILLTWSAKGAGGGWGIPLQTGSQYAIQYSTWSGVTFATANAQVVISTWGVANTAPQTFTLNGLKPSTLYYAKVWTRDWTGLWSSASNQASVQTGPLGPVPDTFFSAPLAVNVLGQSNFGAGSANQGGGAPTQSSMNSPYGGDFDQSGNLWVADSLDHRLLRFTTPYTNGMNANLQIGQSGFTVNAPTNGAGGLNTPQGAAFDKEGNLWVADYGNHRVLMYVPPFSNNMSATKVLGQTTFGVAVAGAGVSGMTNPTRVRRDDNGYLWVSDNGNHRVLRFTPPFNNGMSAGLVLGQSSFAGVSANRGGAVADNTLNGPMQVDFDPDGNLWLADSANNRVLRYDQPFTNGQSASLVLGQAGFGTAGTATTAAGMSIPNGVFFDGAGTLWVSERDNSRVTRFYPPFTNGMAASEFIGQADGTTATLATTQNGLKRAVAMGADTGGRLFLADRDNHRVLRSTPTAFSSVLATTATVRVGPNYNDSSTQYQVEIDVDPAFAAPAPTVSAYGTGLSRTFTSLSPNTTQYVRAKARNTGLVESGYTDFGSTITLCNVPNLNNPFQVWYTSASFTWLANLNPAGSVYHAQVSTDASFATMVWNSSFTTSTSVLFRGLASGATYYGRVRAQNFAGTLTAYSLTASTVTSAANMPDFAPLLRIGMFDGSFVYNTSTSSLSSPPTALDMQSVSGLKIAQQALTTSSNTIAHWRFDEGVGPTTIDETGYRNHGTTIGGPSFTSGLWGNALQLNGSTQYVSVSSTTQFDLATDFTIEMWLKFNSVAPAAFIGRDTGGGAVNKWVFWLDSGNLLRFHLNGPGPGAQYPVSIPWTPTVSTWYQLALTRQGSVYNLYRDGVRITSGTNATAIPLANVPVTIGYANGDSPSYFNGVFDEVRMLNRALAPDEVAADYMSGGLRYSTTGANGSYTYVVRPASVAFSGTNDNTALVTSTVTAPTLADLAPNYVQFFVRDVAGQEWTTLPYNVPASTSSPQPITDLAAVNVAGSSVPVVQLTWTSPLPVPLRSGSYYAIQASTTLLTGFGWSTAAAQVVISTTGNAGVTQTIRLYGLLPDRPYYFRAWATNDSLIWSLPSLTTATISRTLASPPTQGSNFYANQPASVVMGQPDFTTVSAVTSQSKLANPFGGGVDPFGNVWVGEMAPSYRVVRYPAPHYNNGPNADLVLGQAGFGAGGAALAQNRMNLVQSVAFDIQGNAYVMDFGNVRVLRFDPPFTNGMNASNVIGQADFTTAASAVTQGGLSSPRDLVFDPQGNLWIADYGANRLLRYRPPFERPEQAGLVLGQNLFTAGGAATTQGGLSGPSGVAFDAAGNLYVAELGNNRVLRYSPPFSNGMNANLVLGQADFTSGSANRGGATAANTLSGPVRLSVDGDGGLWVIEAGNHRAVKYVPPFTNGMAASVLLGQPAFTSGAANQGGSAGAGTMSNPTTALVDALGAVWVADSSNFRMLRHGPQALTTTGPNTMASGIGSNGNALTTQFEVQISSVPGFANTVASSGLGGQTPSFSSLVPNTLYHGQARSQNGDGLFTAFTYLGSTRTQAAQPLQLTVTLASNTQVTLSWNANLNPPNTQYEASLSTDNFTAHFSTQMPFTNGLTATSTTHSSLAFGTTYFFRVRARNLDPTPVNGAFSAVTSTETIPDRPTNLAGTVLGISSIAWSWNSAGGGAARYTVRTTTVSPSPVLPGASDLKVTTYTTTGLKPNVPYGVQVEAFDNSGSGGLTAQVTHYTFAAPPIGLGRIAVSSFSIGVAWNTSQNPSYTQYELSYSTDALFPPLATSTQTFGVFGVSTAAILGLEGGTSYYIRVRGRNDEPGGLGGPVNTAFASLLTQTVPGPVPIVKGTVLGVSSISWTWNSSGGGATLYRIYDGYTGSLYLNNSTNAFYLQTGLVMNTPYALQVEAYSQSGSAGLSPPATHYTYAAVPANLAATLISTSGVSMSWSPAGNPGYTLYELTESTDNFSSIQSTPVAFTDIKTLTNATVSSLVQGSTTYFRVRAQNNETIFLSTTGTVATAFSNILKVQLPPMDVGAVTVATLGTSSLAWTWAGSTATFNVYTATGGLLSSGQAGATFTKTGLTPNTPYAVRIQANSGGQLSVLTDPVTGYTLAQAPVSPALVSVTSGSLVVTWSAGSNPGNTIYEVGQSLDGFSLDFSTPVPQQNGLTGTAYSMTGLSAGLTHYYRVRAFNQNNIATAFTATVSTQTLPKPPSGLTATVLGMSSVTWTWDSAGGSALFFGQPVRYDLRRPLLSPNGAPFAGALTPALMQAVPGTAGLWNINEAAGATTADGSGGAHTMTLTNAVRVAGKQSYALRFDSAAANGYASTPDSAQFDLADYTLEAWVKTGEAGSGDRRIVGQGNDWGLNLQDDRIAVCDIRDFPGGCQPEGGAINDNQYHHLAVARRSGVDYRFFVDGQLVAIESAGNAGPTASLSTVDIGRNSLTGHYFGGDIDEVRVLARALTDAELAEDGAGRLPYTETALTPNTAYGATLQAYDDSGSAGLTAPTTRYTLAEAPSALAISGVSSNTVVLTWSRGSNPAASTYFELHRSQDNFSQDDVVIVAFATQYTGTNYNPPGLAPGTHYAFKVRARNGESVVTDYSNTASTDTLPGGATNLAGSAVGVSSISWTWDPAPGAGTLYRVISTSGPVIATGLTSTAYVQTMLSTNTVYGVQIQPYNNAGIGALLGPVTVYTFAAAPAALVDSSATTTTAAFAWDAQGNPAGTLYEVSLSTVPGFAAAVSTPIPFTDNLTAAATRLFNLQVGTPYYARIRARNNPGTTTSFSNTASTVTVPGQVPTGSVSGSVLGTASIFWSWSPAPGASVSYRVRSSTAPANYLLETPATSYLQVGLLPNQSYGVTVEAYNTTGSSLPFAGPVTRVTAAAAPAALDVAVVPVLNLVGVTSTSISIAWSENGNPAATPYEVSESTDLFTANFSTPIAFTAYTATYTVRSPLATGTVYSYRVRAQNAAGANSSFSNTISTKTLALPGAVTDLSGTGGFTAGVIRLAWTSPGDNGNFGDLVGGGYRLDWSTASGHIFDFSSYQIEIPTTTPPGRAQSYTASGLLPGTSYFVGLFTRNGQGIWSALSNRATVYATPFTTAFTIDAGALLDLGSVPMGTSKVGEFPTLISNTGNTSLTLVLSASTSTAGTPWILLTASTTASGLDTAMLCGAVALSQPGAAEFDLFGNVIHATPRAATAADFTLDGALLASGIPSSQTLTTAQQRRLWYRLDMPPYTTTAAPQQMRVTIVGTSP